MLRTLGFVTGVGISITGLLLVLEPAELQRLQAETTARVAQMLPQQTDSSRWWDQLRNSEGASEVAPPPGVSPPVPVRVKEPTADAQQGSIAGPGSTHEPAPSATSEPRIPIEIPREPVTADYAPTTFQEPRSHLFWNPFRSEPAAKGFADRLSTATDVAVVVTQEGPANYRVGFNYRNDAERRALIERIETVTGLELE